MLVDLNELVRPDFVVMDAVVGMEGNGPMGGDLRFAGYVLASHSVYALDVSAQRPIGGWSRNQVATTGGVCWALLRRWAMRWCRSQGIFCRRRIMCRRKIPGFAG